MYRVREQGKSEIGVALEQEKVLRNPENSRIGSRAIVIYAIINTILTLQLKQNVF